MIYKFIFRLERLIARLKIQRLITFLTGAMLIIFVTDMLVMSKIASTTIYQLFYFNRSLILQGQVWRILTFVLLYPNMSNLIFTLLSMYFYWWVGSSIEEIIGSARFNTYYFLGVVGAIIAGSITGVGTTDMLNYSLFFALAFLRPYQQIRIYFVIPVELRYLAIFHAVIFFIMMILFLFFRNFSDSLAIFFSFLNFILFFGAPTIRAFKRKYNEWKYYRR